MKTNFIVQIIANSIKNLFQILATSYLNEQSEEDYDKKVGTINDFVDWIGDKINERN